jgi:hypothetical protein
MKNIKTYRLFESNELSHEEIKEYFYDFTDTTKYEEKCDVLRSGLNNFGDTYLEINFGIFPKEKLDILFECLLRFYDGTGFRSSNNIKSVTYMYENTEQVIMYKTRLMFFIINDEKYNDWCETTNKYYIRAGRKHEENIKLQKIFTNEKH